MPRLPIKHLSSGATIGDVLSWNGTSWVSAPAPVGFTAGGDLSGSATNQTVQGLQGALFANTTTSPGLSAVHVTEATFPFVDSIGCVSDGTYLWVCDSSTPYVFKVDPSNWFAPIVRINLNISAVPSTPNPSNLFLSGNYIICTAGLLVFMIDWTLDTLVAYINLGVIGGGTQQACIDGNNNLWTSSPSGVQRFSVSAALLAFPNAYSTSVGVALSAGQATSLVIGPDSLVWAGRDADIYQINPANDSVISHTESGMFHEYLFSAVGFIWVSQYGNANNNILRYDPGTFPGAAPTQIAINPLAEFPGWMTEYNGILYVADNDIARVYTINTAGPTYTGFVSNGSATEWINQITPLTVGATTTIWMGITQGVDGFAPYIVGGSAISATVTAFSGGNRVRWETPTVKPLANTFYLDGGTTTPLDSQTGSIGQPFGFLHKALPGIGSVSYPGPTLLIAPGDYTFESKVYWMSPGNPPAALNLKGLGTESNLPALPDIQALSGNLNLERLYMSGTVQGGSYVTMTSVSVGTAIASYIIAKNSTFQGSLYVEGGSFQGCTFANSTLYTTLILGNDVQATVDTTTNNTLRVRSILLDAYTSVVVTSGATTSKATIVSDLTAPLAAIGLNVSLNPYNQIVFQSSTGHIEVDTVLNGSTLNTAIDLTDGVYGPATVKMDSKSYGSFRETSGIYRGIIALDEGKSNAQFRQSYVIGTGAAWVNLIVLDSPLADEAMMEVDWCIYGKLGAEESLLRREHSLIQRLNGVTTVLTSTTELISPNAVSNTRIIVSGDFIAIQLQQDSVKNWNAKAEATWLTQT